MLDVNLPPTFHKYFWDKDVPCLNLEDKKEFVAEVKKLLLKSATIGSK